MSPLSCENVSHLTLFLVFELQARLLMRVHHRNVASLVGYCHEGTNMWLIYEYMAGGNLQNYLSGKFPFSCMNLTSLRKPFC